MKPLDKIRKEFAAEIPNFDRKTVIDEIDRLRKLRNHLLACEYEAASEIDSKIDILQASLDARTDYKELDVSFLKRFTTSAKGVPFKVPKLVFIPVDKPTGTIELQVNRFGTRVLKDEYFSGTNQPDIVCRAWEKMIGYRWRYLVHMAPALSFGSAIAVVWLWVIVAGYLAFTVGRAWAPLSGVPMVINFIATLAYIMEFSAGHLVWESREFTLKSRMAGVVPEDIRAKLTDWRKTFKQVYFCREVEEWETSQDNHRARNFDPLVVGEDHTGRLYLLDVFDATPLESYIKSEFAV